MGNKRYFAREDLIDWMQRIKEQQCGKSSIFGPTKKQIRLARFAHWERKPLLKDFIDEFSSYEEAIKAAGYEVPPEEILSSIETVPPPDPVQTTDPSQEKEKNMPRPQPRSEEELLADFRAVTAELGHSPTSAEWEKLRKSGRKITSATTYFSKFGRWADIPRIAGITPEPEPASTPEPNPAPPP